MHNDNLHKINKYLLLTSNLTFTMSHFLFKPIYKKKFLTIIKLDIFGKTCPKG